MGLPPTIIYFEAVILDLDGLLIDTEPSYQLAWQGALNALEIKVPDGFWEHLSGCDFTQVESALANQLQELFPLARFRELSATLWWQYVNQYGLATKPGYHQLIRQLKEKNLPYCIATNSLLKNAEDCMRLAGIQKDFDLLVTRDQVIIGKPSPALFLLAAKCLKQCPARCLAVDDSLTGIAAAIEANMISIMIPGAPKKLQTPRKESVYFMHSLTDFASLLECAECDGYSYCIDLGKLDDSVTA